MTALELAFASALLCALSGVPALFSGMPLFHGRRIACILLSGGAAAGLAAAARILLLHNDIETFEMAWRLPIGELLFRLDQLSAFFLIPVLVVAVCISLYTCGYCSTTPDNRGESLLTFYLGLVISSIILLLISASGITLLIFWESMALMVYLAMCLEHGRPEVREAGLQYLVASHITTLLMIVLFALIAQYNGQSLPASGSLDPATPAAVAIFLTALIAFGMKAGIMPLHVWLPTAHANAPSQISAVMSGIVLKMGIYGLLRVISFFSTPPLWWGVLLLCLGIVSAVVGVLFAIGQHDIKRLLAYHSIENIGIIVMGIGVALIGLTTGHRILFVLGMAGALLHVLNHALFKSLLFLGAGAVIHVTGTRDIDRMGGLSRSLPLTSLAFLTGSVAICGLPPLNGFVSELLIYLGIFKGFGITAGTAAAVLGMSAPLLALTGGLALACFVKVYGGVFLGEPRSPLPDSHESPAMNYAMTILAGLCLLIGVLPFAAIRLVEPVVASIYPQRGEALPEILTTAHLYGLSLAAAALILLIFLLGAWYLSRLKTGPIGETGTWDCGYAAPAPSMQYTASSFAEMLVGIFGGILCPERHQPDIKGLFPGRTSFRSHVPEVVLEKGILPFFSAADRRLAAIRRLQSGQLNHYILYIFIALIFLFALSYFL
ncbi:MAG: proton-conducting transporter membrane subunit [Desulfobacteraceae bacterium]|nr:proton-conducting transporter membrane subunit [Desulfobacteraceae bacterium]